ncbi:vacuolar cation/proton exchanger 3-like [Cucumis sativus]|uniref:Vacuolar cation/proton exchanger n=1 Tax=Cucumis sativus TaxID=3659 RepID=J7KG37_CUCSA|nr:vacuolar cation/proton exchanger 3-like [Cucumis sativus]AFQ99296.1 cation exchanger CAX4 [Cucumis sativus]
MGLNEPLVLNGDLEINEGAETVAVSLPVRFGLVRELWRNLVKVVFGTKLAVLFPAIPLAVAADFYSFGRTWIFGLSLLGLAPLAERVSFLTEQIACYTGHTVGGLVNATCGNATELIIAMFALHQNKVNVLKFSLLGSILSNLLLVLGTSLLFGGLSNLNKQQTFNLKVANVSCVLLLLGLLCQTLPLMFTFASPTMMISTSVYVLQLSRTCSLLMLTAYIAYVFFQLKTHHQFFGLPQEEEDEEEEEEEERAVVGIWSSIAWLVGMTILISILSQYIVATIEDASKSWGVSMSFVSIILVPIMGNAAEHAGSIIFAVKNKLDITLGIALGSAAQISLFVVPLSVIVGWCMGIKMDLDFGIIETSSLAFTIILTIFTLQDGSSNYIKGLVLVLSYVAISSCFFCS